MRIASADLDDPRVHALLATHAETARAETARGSAHALDPAAFRAPDIALWVAWEGDVALATGALRTPDADQGEVKAMHTAQAARRRGAASAILAHIIATAREKGLRRLSLETGAWPYFAPAHAFYRTHGFRDCAPFGDYAADPNSLFLTLDLA